MATIQMDKPREFSKLFLASFISNSGSCFMTLSLAAVIYALTGSAAKAALVMVFSYLPAVFLSGRVGHEIDKKVSARMLVMFEAGAALISLICGILIYFDFFMALLIPLSIRSILTFSTRAAVGKWIKLITPGEKAQDFRIKIFLLGFFLSTTVAGILTGLVLSDDIHVAIRNVVIIDVLTYLLSILVILFLDRTPPVAADVNAAPQAANVDNSTSIAETFVEIIRQPLLKRAFLIVISTQTIFQGAYQAIIPIISKHFDLGIRGIAIFQVAASIGLIAAFIILWRFPNFLKQSGEKTSSFRSILVALGGVLSITAVASISFVSASILSFGFVTLFYEMLWLASRGIFFVGSPPNFVARYQFLMDSSGLILMSLSTFGYAVCIESFGFRAGTLLFLTFGLSMIGVIYFIANFHLKKIVF